MIQFENCDSCGIVVTRALEPFQFDNLLDSAKKQAGNSSLDEVFGRPLLLDFRSVKLVKYSSEDFRRDIRRRFELTKDYTDVPCALISGSDTDFGMLRMYATYAEIGGVRSTGNTFVSCSIDEGIAWLKSKRNHSKNCALSSVLHLTDDSRSRRGMALLGYETR